MFTITKLIIYFLGSGSNTITAKIKAAVNALENRVIYPKDNIMTILTK